MESHAFLASLPLWRWVVVIAIYAMFLLIVAGLVYFLCTGGSKNLFLKKLYKNYEGLGIRQNPQVGDVQLVYHTYRGILLWFIQEEHRVFASRGDAMTLLNRLLRFNLTFGLMTPWFFLVPFLALGNYFSQKKKLRF